MGSCEASCTWWNQEFSLAGRCIIIQDQDRYNDQLKKTLDSTMYKKLRKNPLPALTKDFNPVVKAGNGFLRSFLYMVESRVFFSWSLYLSWSWMMITPPLSAREMCKSSFKREWKVSHKSEQNVREFWKDL